MSREVRRLLSEAKARAVEVDSPENRTKAGDIFFEFARKLCRDTTDSSRYVRRSAAEASYQALMRYLVDGNRRQIKAVENFVTEQNLLGHSYQLEATIKRAMEFLGEIDQEEVTIAVEETGSDQENAVHQAEGLIKAARINDSEGEYLSAARNYMEAAKLLFSCFEGDQLLTRAEEPVRNALLRLVMADEWELAGEFAAIAQFHSIPIDEALVLKITAKKALIDQYVQGARQIRVLSEVELQGVVDPEEIIARIMREGFRLFLDEHREISVLSAWRLDYLRGVVPVELEDICTHGTESVGIKKLIWSIHENFGADTFVVKYKAPYFSGAMVFSTSEALDLEIIRGDFIPA